MNPPHVVYEVSVPIWNLQLLINLHQPIPGHPHFLMGVVRLDLFVIQLLATQERHPLQFLTLPDSLPSLLQLVFSMSLLSLVMQSVDHVLHGVVLQSIGAAGAPQQVGRGQAGVRGLPLLRVDLLGRVGGHLLMAFEYQIPFIQPWQLTPTPKQVIINLCLGFWF